MKQTAETAGGGAPPAGLTLDQLRALPAVVDLRTAARAFGLGRTRAYELAARGQFPCRVLRIGGTYRVPTADLLAVVGLPTAAVDGSAEAARDSRDPSPAIDEGGLTP